MKKKIWTLLLLVCIICACGCNADKDLQNEKQTLVINGQTDESSSYAEMNKDEEEHLSGNKDKNNSNAPIVGADVPIDASGTAPNAQNYGNNHSFSAEQNAGGSAYVITVPNAGAQGSKDNTADYTQTIPNNDISIDMQEKTEAEWIADAQALYKEGCDVAFRYLCTGSEFPFDRENLEIIDKTYFLTTCLSFEEATAPYYRLFSREYHGNDFDGLLVSQNGRLYAARSARGMDMTYISSDVKHLMSLSENEAVFSVLLEYEDHEDTAEFTLVREDGEWKIGKFTLPY